MTTTDPELHLALLLVSLLCLGLWIAAFQLRPRQLRFELFAIDFAVGAFLFAVLAALLLGSFGTDLPFSDRLLVSSKTAQALLVIGGLLFGVANTLLLGAISLLDVPVAFGISGSIGLLVGVLLNRTGLHANALPVIAALLFVACALAAWTSRTMDLKRPPHPRGQPLGPIELRRSTKGILVAALAGAGISFSYQLARRGTFEDFGLGPYAALFFFCGAALAINLIFSLYFFNIALEGGALSLRTYLLGWPAKHIAGMLAGVVWAAGALAALLAHTPAPLTPANQTLGTQTPATDALLPLAFVPVAMLLGVFLQRNSNKLAGLGLVLVSCSLLAIGSALAIWSLF